MNENVKKSIESLTNSKLITVEKLLEKINKEAKEEFKKEFYFSHDDLIECSNEWFATFSFYDYDYYINKCHIEVVEKGERPLQIEYYYVTKQDENECIIEDYYFM